MSTYGGWNFDTTYTSLPEKFYSLMDLNPVREPKLVLFNDQLAAELDLNVDELKKHGAPIFAGNEVPENATPLAQAYAGHQFGHLTKLGDGRALLIGEHVTTEGERVDIQLKGSGRTPYSRGGDGRAALGPMLREYIISEAMHGLNLPTTRSLAVVTTGEKIMREKMYEGAILTRVARSHLRVGTFQYAYHLGTDRDLDALVQYAIETLYPESKEADHPVLALLEHVIEKQALLIAQWQLVGFIHGVMNTDNMTISGETIDYGPCAFLDTYRRATVFSSIDTAGRYAYQNQPTIGEWNLARFAETLIPLLHDDEEEAIQLAKDALAQYRPLSENAWLDGMRKKLGMEGERESDEALIHQLLNLMETHKADYTNTFLALTFQQFTDEPLYQSEGFKAWYEKWRTRVDYENNQEAILTRMKQHNPAIIPRNYYVEEAIEAAVAHHDFTKVHDLVEACKEPYAHTGMQKKYQIPPDFDGLYQTFCGT